MTTPIDALRLTESVTPAEIDIWRMVQPFTMTSFERVVAAVRAIDHIVAHGVRGDLVECGVWRGGSMMAMALALLRHGDAGRSLFLYDTFAGMTDPGPRDVQFDGRPAAEVLVASPRDAEVWAVASLEEARRNVLATGYPPDCVHFIAGAVEETIPATVPETTAILRLDTDWYASTRHELVHLWPRLSDGGVLIVDDYGHWRGAREATDEYFAAMPDSPHLHAIDYTGVMAIKGWR